MVFGQARSQFLDEMPNIFLDADLRFLDRPEATQELGAPRTLLLLLTQGALLDALGRLVATDSD